MAQKAPTKLYKFQACNDYSIQNLKRNQIWFSKSEKLNDPFDCAISFVFDWTDDDFRTFYDYFSEPKDQGKNVSAFLDDWYFTDGKPSQKYRRKVEHYNKIFKIKMRDRISKMGIACFTENLNNLLMWSHYAESHKGFCIEFNTGFAPFHKPDILREVIYSYKYPSLFPAETVNTEGLPDTVLRTKSKSWDYEKEWRLLLDKGDNAFKYDPRALTAIYFGCSMPEKSIRRIATIFTHSTTQLFRMQRSETEFKLDYIPYHIS